MGISHSRVCEKNLLLRYHPLGQLHWTLGVENLLCIGPPLGFGFGGEGGGYRGVQGTGGRGKASVLRVRARHNLIEREGGREVE